MKTSKLAIYLSLLLLALIITATMLGASTIILAKLITGLIFMLILTIISFVDELYVDYKNKSNKK